MRTAPNHDRHLWDAAPGEPERLKCRRELQCPLVIGVVSAPRERCPQIVDVGFCLLDVLPSAGRARLVEEGGQVRVVVAVAGAYRIGFARLAELLQRVLPHRLQQPVSRWAAGVLGDNERLVNEQRELIEDLVALQVLVGDDGLRGVEVESAEEHRQSAEEHALEVSQQRMRPIDRGPQASVGAAPRCARRPSVSGTGPAGR